MVEDTQTDIRLTLDKLVGLTTELERQQYSAPHLRLKHEAEMKLKAQVLHTTLQHTPTHSHTKPALLSQRGGKELMDQREGITLVDRTLMRRGEVFLALGKPAEAVKAYEQYAAKAWEVWNFTALTEVYARIVALYEQTRKYDLFFINVERYRSIAVRAGRKDDEGLAMEAQARGLLREFRYRTALHMYERILDHWVGIKDEPGRARALRGMETCWVELKDVQKAKEFGKACNVGVVVVGGATDDVRCPSPSQVTPRAWWRSTCQPSSHSHSTTSSASSPRWWQPPCAWHPQSSWSACRCSCHGRETSG